jgi:hypothetical protein
LQLIGRRADQAWVLAYLVNILPLIKPVALYAPKYIDFFNDKIYNDDATELKSIKISSLALIIGRFKIYLSYPLLVIKPIILRPSMPIGNIVSKKQVLAPGIAAALIMMAPALLPEAFAAPTLHGGGCDATDSRTSATLECNLDVSGLGGATTATATLSGDATITTGCLNRGGNEPSGLERTNEDVVASDTVNVKGGRATFDLSQTFTAEDIRDCPSRNMTPVVVCAEFTGLEVEVVPNSGPSRTFDLPDESTC